jgi:hypothetical protein
MLLPAVLPHTFPRALNVNDIFSAVDQPLFAVSPAPWTVRAPEYV